MGPQILSLRFYFNFKVSKWFFKIVYSLWEVLVTVRFKYYIFLNYVFILNLHPLELLPMKRKCRVNYSSSLYEVDVLEQFLVDVHVSLELPRVVVEAARLQVQLRDQPRRPLVHQVLHHLQLEISVWYIDI